MLGPTPPRTPNPRVNCTFPDRGWEKRLVFHPRVPRWGDIAGAEGKVSADSIRIRARIQLFWSIRYPWTAYPKYPVSVDSKFKVSEKYPSIHASPGLFYIPLLCTPFVYPSFVYSSHHLMCPSHISLSPLHIISGPSVGRSVCWTKMSMRSRQSSTRK